MEFSKEDLLNLEHKVISILITSSSYLKDAYQKQKDVAFKTTHSPVTHFDKDIENDLRNKLQQLVPQSGFIVEEGETSEKDEYNWTIDPIDGTRNFVGALPLFYVQCALVYKNDPILGVIYNPVSEQVFSASLYNGCRINGQNISQLPSVKLENTVIDVDFGPKNDGLSWKLSVIKALAEKCSRVRISGGAFAPYIVTRAIDIFIVLNETTKTVDQMPRIILARESGMKAEALTLRSKKILITAPSELFEIIKSTIEDSIV